ncbi:uncharacterized protein [Rutidosis leptorrhynchoides]|uniref:uncharacterized protein n=1 Tax=Rutidosis leptorrhynchoides TaxID=125765 RepID=UPI003A9A369E
MVSINIRGFNKDGKGAWFRELVAKSNPMFALVQETKCSNINDRWVERLWNSSNFGYAFKNPIGKSGGFLLIWDNTIFSAEHAFEGEFYIAIKARFNSFIGNNGLIEIPLVGKRFTRISDDGIKFSKLDRFLVSNGCLQHWDSLSIVPLDRKIFDHSPLLLKNGHIDFGSKPIRIFDAWLEDKDAEGVILSAWNKLVKAKQLDHYFRIKLKNVKDSLKTWRKQSFDKIDE